MRPHLLSMNAWCSLPRRSSCICTCSGLNNALSALALRSCALTDSAKSFQRGSWLSILVLQLGPMKTLGPSYPSHFPKPACFCHPLLVPNPSCFHASRPDMYMFSGRNSLSIFCIESKSASVYLVSDWRWKITAGGMPEVMRKRTYLADLRSRGTGTKAQTVLACSSSATEVAIYVTFVRWCEIGRLSAALEWKSMQYSHLLFFAPLRLEFAHAVIAAVPAWSPCFDGSRRCVQPLPMIASRSK